MPSEPVKVEFKSPTKKLLAFFEKSRDRWKAKHLHTKQLLKKEQNQVRAVQRSRDHWRAKAKQAEADKQRLHKECEDLECEDLKKFSTSESQRTD